MSKNLNELGNEVQQLLGSEFICTQKTIQKNNTKLNAITIRVVEGDVIGEVFYVDKVIIRKNCCKRNCKIF